MRITASTPVKEILSTYADASDVLDWYGVEPDEVEGKELTVKELCKTYDVELEEMLADLQALADEAEGDDEDDEDADDEDSEDADSELDDEDDDEDDSEDLYDDDSEDDLEDE